MEDGEQKPVDAHAFDLYDRIRSTVGEYCDDWIMVGKRCDNDHKVIIGTTNNGWGDLKPVYSYIQRWKNDNNIGKEKQ